MPGVVIVIVIVMVMAMVMMIAVIEVGRIVLGVVQVLR